MNKNTLTAFVLMALVVFGFMAYENYARREQMAEQAVTGSAVIINMQKISQMQRLSNSAADTTFTTLSLKELHQRSEHLSVTNWINLQKTEIPAYAFPVMFM